MSARVWDSLWSNRSAFAMWLILAAVAAACASQQHGDQGPSAAPSSTQRSAPSTAAETTTTEYPSQTSTLPTSTLQVSTTLPPIGPTASLTCNGTPLAPGPGSAVIPSRGEFAWANFTFEETAGSSPIVFRTFDFGDGGGTMRADSERDLQDLVRQHQYQFAGRFVTEVTLMDVNGLFTSDSCPTTVLCLLSNEMDLRLEYVDLYQSWFLADPSEDDIREFIESVHADEEAACSGTRANVLPATADDVLPTTSISTGQGASTPGTSPGTGFLETPYFSVPIPVGYSPVTIEQDVGYGLRTRLEGPDGKFIVIEHSPWGGGTVEEAAEAVAAGLGTRVTAPVEYERMGDRETWSFSFLSSNDEWRDDIFFKGDNRGFAVLAGGDECGGVTAAARAVVVSLQEPSEAALSVGLDLVWHSGVRGRPVLAPRRWAAEFVDGCGSGSWSFWSDPTDPGESIRLETGVSRGSWLAQDGDPASIDPTDLLIGTFGPDLSLIQASPTAYVFIGVTSLANPTPRSHLNGLFVEGLWVAETDLTGEPTSYRLISLTTSEPGLSYIELVTEVTTGFQTETSE